MKMKKLTAILLAAMMLLSLAACGGDAEHTDNAEPSQNTPAAPQTPSEPDNSPEPEDVPSGPDETPDTPPEDVPSEPEQEPTGSKILVAYFSATNNTEGIAQKLADGLGADIYEITPEQPYTDEDLDYGDSQSRSSVEMDDPDARPAISGSVENMEQYDVVFIGYPIWWGDTPTIIKVFLQSYDFSGKTIIPFCAHGGSGLSGTDRTISGLCPDSTIGDGLAIRGSTAQNDRDSTQESVTKWLSDSGY